MTTKKAAGKAEKTEIVTRKQPRGVREIKLEIFNGAEKVQQKEKTTSKRQPKARIQREKTLAQIAKEQGVKPFDPSENGKNWPKGADFQEFINAIHSGRNNGK